MQWLSKIVDEIVAEHPAGEVLIESGSSPSGTYHLGHMRELIICDAILIELKRRGRQAKHIAYVDDLDALRKIPVNVPADYEQYLGRSLCDIPAPDGSDKSYADYFIQDLVDVAAALGMEIEFVRSHEKYRSGFFAGAIEKALENTEKIKQVLEAISGHKLDETWSPIQINEDGYLKKRRFVSLDKAAKTLKYIDKEGQERETSYSSGEVKLDWRIDWPARWAYLNVQVEPFGRDHATKGGSYDTGAELCRQVFEHKPPMPVPYDFVNMVGDTKKMSASKGTGLDAVSAVKILPPEIIRFFMLRYPPSKRIYFDPVEGVTQLIDEFAELVSTEPDSPLVEICRRGIEPSVGPIPFSQLVANYQASLKDLDVTLEALKRSAHGREVESSWGISKNELKYIDNWLKQWAPEDVKFDLIENVNPADFAEDEKSYLNRLADEVDKAPENADGEWFHKAIYQFKESDSLAPTQLFGPLYRVLIGKEQGPRAGWFLSILPRDWLIKRLRLEA